MKPYSQAEVDEALLAIVDTLARYGMDQQLPALTEDQKLLRDGLAESFDHLDVSQAKHSLAAAHVRISELRQGFLLACAVLQTHNAAFRDAALDFQSHEAAGKTLLKSKDQKIGALEGDLRTRAEAAKSRAKKAAEARHGKEGGTRDKARKLLEIWASGKYRTRELCAEEEARALGMSFSTARKVLQNAPRPDRGT